MYRKIPYTEIEKQVVGTRPNMMGLGNDTPVYNTPVTARANFDAMFDERHPYWMPSIRETVSAQLPLYNNTLGRGMRADITDIFGIKWRFVPDAGGSIVEPGAPLMEDMNDWRKIVKIPDVDSWDWAGAAKEKAIDTRFSAQFTLINGFGFERMISFMDFMPAAMALIDDEQADAIKDFLAAMSELGCRVIDKVCQYMPGMDLIEIHDDWGAQKAPFFSMDVAYEFFVPFMKQMTDRIHANGRRALLHSCGHNADRIQCYIDGGFDLWQPQAMNDIGYLYDNYGDKIILAVFPEETDIPERSEDEQRALARAFVDRFCQPGKPSVTGMVSFRRTTEAFNDEVYEYSRKKYLAE